MQIGPRELDHFVATSDSLGSPGSPPCAKFWEDFKYVPGFQVDQDLDPFSEAYVAQQFELYKEIAGHTYDVHSHEKTQFDLQRHIDATNPYDHPDPAALATHLLRLSTALRCAKPQRGDSLLDMGCGWGLSSELAAYLGLKVTAVDVNPDFVNLVNSRAQKGARAISAVLSTFDDFVPTEAFDVALFYECLHHSVRPWQLVSRLTEFLKTGGRLVLAGEPINSYWWKYWGLRLDPMSIYCIRKFGWFESGWTKEFIQQVLFRSGLIPRVYLSSDPEIGYTVAGEKARVFKLPAVLVDEMFKPSSCLLDGSWLIMVGSGQVRLSFPTGSKKAIFNVVNFRGRPLHASLKAGGMTVYSGSLRAGNSDLEVPRLADELDLYFDIETWIPDDELRNGDRRTLGLHLESITFPSDG